MGIAAVIAVADPEVRELLVDVANAMGRSPDAITSASPLQRNYFSLILFIRWNDGAEHAVKLPRTDLRARSTEGLTNVTSADRALAQAEADSLNRLANEWDGEDVRVRWVRPVVFLPVRSVLVTERADAGEVCEPYRRLSRAAALGSGTARRGLADRMRRFGTALGRIHRLHAQTRTADVAALAARIGARWNQLPAGARTPSLERQMGGMLSQLAVSTLDDVETMTLKGIDIRNVLESADGDMWIVDPGKTKRASREADIARFGVTWRILHWGSAAFAAGLTPPAVSDRAFLEACDAGLPANPRLRAVYFLKEVIKHWVTGYDSLAFRAPGGWKRGLVGRLYIDRFYRREARRWLRELA